MKETSEGVPPHVRMLWALTSWIYWRRRRLSGLGAIIFTLGFLATGIQFIKSGEMGVVRRFGRILEAPAGPGAVYVIPGVESLERVSVGSVRRIELARQDGTPLELTTGDENLISLRLQLQYRVEDPVKFLAVHKDPEVLLRSIAMASATRQASVAGIETVLTTGKALLQEAMRLEVQGSSDSSSLGVRVLGLSIVSSGPPLGAEDAFTAVSTAQSEREKRVNEAEGKRSEAMALARAEADRTLRSAESSRRERVESAKAGAEKFKALAREAALSRRSTMERLHRETLERAGARARLVVLPPAGKTRSLFSFTAKTAPQKVSSESPSSKPALEEMALPPIVPEEISKRALEEKPPE